jgi:hypothetical protein
MIDRNPTVTMTHVRAAKLCSRGTREWFKHHNLSFDEFITNGYPAETLLATGDEMAVRVVAEALKESDNG